MSPAAVTIRPICGFLWSDAEKVASKKKEAVSALKEVFSGYLDGESYESAEGIHFASTLQLLEDNEAGVLRISEKMPEVTFCIEEHVSAGTEYYTYLVLVSRGEKCMLRFAADIIDEA